MWALALYSNDLIYRQLGCAKISGQIDGYRSHTSLPVRSMSLKQVEEEDRWQEEFSRLLHEDIDDDDDEEVKVLVRRILPH